MRKKKNEHEGELAHELKGSRVYTYLGVHREGEMITFRVWAPNAEAAFLVGDFNLWDESCKMVKGTGGVFSLRLPAERISYGSRYKFKLQTKGGDIYRSDPLGLWFESNGGLSSLFFESRYEWRDGGWMKYRAENAEKRHEQAMNIYELSVGTWKRRGDGSVCSYSELARELAPYIKGMGYTHVQLMPVTDHTDDILADRRTIGLYAPASAYGDPDELRLFVDKMHRAGIGVIFDLGSLDIEKCEAGLSEFDGTPLYEVYDGDVPHFDISKPEVKEFLISNTLFWASEFHADGLFLGSVSSMLYPDRDRDGQAGRPNVYGTARVPGAVKFFRELNERLKESFPDVMTIARESSAWSNVTGTDKGGLGFDFKWNMGFTADTLSYADTDPYFRSGIHERLTFPPVYSFAEGYILPFSHEDMTERSLISRMPGEYEHKFASVRLFEAYKMCFPGKKLVCAGSEIGEFDPFSQKRQTQWFLTGYDMHARLKYYFSELNHFYLSRSELWQRDKDADGFAFISSDRRDISVIAFERTDKNGKSIYAAFNFTPVTRNGFALEMPSEGLYREIFSTDRAEFGGYGVVNRGKLRAVKEKAKPIMKIDLPPLGCAIFEKI